MKTSNLFYSQIGFFFWRLTLRKCLKALEQGPGWGWMKTVMEKGFRPHKSSNFLKIKIETNQVMIICVLHSNFNVTMCQQVQWVGGRVVHTFKPFSGLQLSILQFSSILTISTWRQHQIPQAEGSVLQDCTPYPIPQMLRLSPGLLNDRLQIRGSNNPLL